MAGLGALIGIVGPVFLVILIGFGIGRSGILGPDLVRGIGRFIIAVPLPALVFNALATARIGEVFRPDYLTVYGGASLTAFALGFAWFRWGAGGGGASMDRAAVRAAGMALSNSAFVGLSITTQLYGQAGAGPVVLNLMVENFLMIPLLLTLLELGQGDHGHPLQALAGIGRNLLRSGLAWWMVLGAVFAGLGLALPQPLARTVQIVAGSAAPLALITIGASLAGVRLSGQVGAVTTIAAGKLLLHPALVLAFLLLVPVADPLFRTSLVLLAAAPTASLVPVFAQRTHDADTCSAAMLVATAASFATLLVAMALLGVHLPQ